MPDTGPRRRLRDVELEEQLPPEARRALEALRRRHGDQIASALDHDDELTRRFAVDPLGAIASLGIDVPPELSRYAKPRPETAGLFERRGVRMADGSVLPIKVSVRFTGDHD